MDDTSIMKIIKKILILFIIIRLIGSVFAGLGSDGLEVISGQWDVDNNKNIYVTDSSGKAISVLEDQINRGYTQVNFTIKISEFKSENGFFTFDYKSLDDFKYVGIRGGNDKIVIGQYENGKFKDSITQNYEIDPGKNYDVEITIDGTQVFLFFDNEEKISKDFPLKFNNILGFAAARSKSIFKNVTIYSKDKYSESRFADIYEVRADMTGTGLDEMGKIIQNDQGLQNKIPETDILEGIYYANKMNEIILEAIKVTGVANDGSISSLDVKILDEYVYNYHFKNWIVYHGDDENGDESGFHIVQNDGAQTKIYNNKNAVNTVIDGIYHLGFGAANSKKIQNEDRNNNQKYSDLALWLNGFLKEDLKKSKLKNNLKNNYDYNLISGEDFGNGAELYLSKTDGNGIILLNNNQFPNSGIIKFTLTSTSWEKNQNGFLIFDYKNKNNFKYAGARINKNYWTIGEVVNGKYNDKIKKTETLNTDQIYNIKIKSLNGKITLVENGRDKVEYDFSKSFVGTIGFGVDKSTTIFSSEEFNVKNKPSFFSNLFAKFSFF